MTASHATKARVEATYKRLAPIYDLIYGATLQDGRQQAMSRLAPRLGERILEIGVGTGFGAMRYPRGCRVTGIDISAAMILRARERLLRRNARHVALCRMDAARLAFPDATFDAVYAAYVVNVVPDALAVAREITRVCRPGGRVVLLNHFVTDNEQPGRFVDRVLGAVAARAGAVNWNLRLGAFLGEGGLQVISIDRVNVTRVSSVVVCRREAP